jgi:predicted secreted Zn-dependent protease
MTDAGPHDADTTPGTDPTEPGTEPEPGTEAGQPQDTGTPPDDAPFDPEIRDEDAEAKVIERRRALMQRAVIALIFVAVVISTVALAPRPGADEVPAANRATATPAATAPAPTKPPTGGPAITPPPDGELGVPLDIAGRQLLTVLKAEEWTGRTPPRGSMTIAVLVELEAVKSSPYNFTYFHLRGDGGGQRAATVPGRAPMLRYGRLAAGEKLRAWVTFDVPAGQSWVLGYSVPLGSNGARSPVVRVSLNLPEPPPDPTPMPTPTPRPERLPRIPVIAASSFGPNVAIRWYDVTGMTEAEVRASISAVGPLTAWRGQRTIAALETATEHRYSQVSMLYVGCRLVASADPAVTMTHTVVLPRWRPPAGTTRATARWWINLLLETAEHQRARVRLSDAAAARASEVVASASCTDVAHRVTAVWEELQRASCALEVQRYGREPGVTLQACLAE